MNQKQKLEVIQQFNDMFQSLRTSMIAAGGTPIEFEELAQTSVLTLMEKLCTNNIRFCYTAPAIRAEEGEQI